MDENGQRATPREVSAQSEKTRGAAAAVDFHAVSKSYMRDGHPIEVLHGVTATVPTGAVITLVGPSGSGKSSLLSLCNLMSTPDAGEVLVDGREVREWRVQELRRHVGLVFQTATMFPGTVKDNLELGPKLRGETLNDPETYLKRIGLAADVLTVNADELSGGQKQRVALARVLANQPSVLLLDEVTSALDPAAARDVEEWIVQLHNEQGLTLLWVTHNLDQARRVGTQTWLMVDGRVVEATSTEAFFEQPTHELTRRFLDGELGGTLT